MKGHAERVSPKPIGRHQDVEEAVFRGAEPGEAQLHEGASEPAVDTCCLISAVAIRKAPASPDDCRSPVCLRHKCCRHAGAEPYVTHSAINTALQQDVVWYVIDFVI